MASGGPFTTAQARVIKREVARLRQLKRQQKANAVTDTPAPEQLVLTTAELTRVGEFKWTKVKKGAKTAPDRKPLPISSSNQFSVLAPPANEETDRPCDPSPTEPIQPQETAIKAAVAAAAGREDGKKLNHELKRILKETKRAKPQANDRQKVELAAARQAGRVARHLKRNEAEKKRSKAARRRNSADHQRWTHLCEKYGSVINACRVMDYLDRPTKTKLKKLWARVAAANAALKEKQAFAEQMRKAEEANNVDITAAVAESWNKREQPTSILDTGYSGRNIITPADAQRAKLPNLGPSRVGIIDANGSISRALQKTRVDRAGLPPEAGKGIIAPGVRHSLTGGTNFADQGLIMIFHPYYGGVTIHRPEDVDISYTGEPVAAGH